MAIFAKIESDIVVQVINADQTFIDTQAGTWVEAKVDSEIEKENAGIGFTYDSAKNVFTPPQPYPSWTLEESTSEWKPPIAEPDPNPDADGRWLEWNEELYQSDNTKGWEYLELSE